MNARLGSSPSNVRRLTTITVTIENIWNLSDMSVVFITLNEGRVKPYHHYIGKHVQSCRYTISYTSDSAKPIPRLIAAPASIHISHQRCLDL